MDAWPSTLAVACGAIESGFVHHENYSRIISSRPLMRGRGAQCKGLALARQLWGMRCLSFQRLSSPIERCFKGGFANTVIGILAGKGSLINRRLHPQHAFCLSVERDRDA
jgi:hypothetical protein